MGRKKKRGEWTLYIHKNKQKGKVYVGITSRKPEERWGYNGNGYKPDKEADKPTHFWLAIQKYGWESFEHQIILTGLFKDEAELLEQQYIQLFDSYENGYNSTYGGSLGSKGYRHTDEAKRSMTEKRKGVKHTKEWSKHISEAQLCKRPVICLETGIIYDNPTVCAEMLNFPRQRILETCHGKTHTAYGLHFQYADKDYKSLQEIENEREEIQSKKRKPVVCMETGEVFESRIDCCKKNGISRLGLNRVLRTHHVIKGFHYKNIDDDITLEQIEESHNERCSTKVRCIETGVVFPNITECAKFFNVSNNNIYRVCKLNKKIHTIQGYHLEYINYKPRSRKVICKTTGEIFNNQKECASYFGISKADLSIALGNHDIKVKDMIFEYYDEKDGEVVCL